MISKLAFHQCAGNDWPKVSQQASGLLRGAFEPKSRSVTLTATSGVGSCVTPYPLVPSTSQVGERVLDCALWSIPVCSFTGLHNSRAAAGGHSAFDTKLFLHDPQPANHDTPVSSASSQFYSPVYPVPAFFIQFWTKTTAKVSIDASRGSSRRKSKLGGKGVGAFVGETLGRGSRRGGRTISLIRLEALF